jgi:hypothetical protein
MNNLSEASAVLEQLERETENFIREFAVPVEMGKA